MTKNERGAGRKALPYKSDNIRIPVAMIPEVMRMREDFREEVSNLEPKMQLTQGEYDQIARLMTERQKKRVIILECDHE